MRLRRSVKLGPGVRLTASKKSASLRVGARGGPGYSASTSGRRTKSVSVPGTGVYWMQSSSGGSSKRSSSAASRTAQPAAASALPKAGLFAPGYEKAFAKAVELLVSGKSEAALIKFKEASSKDQGDKAIADDLFAGLLASQLGRHDEAAPYLEKVVQSSTPLPDALMNKYIRGGATTIPVTPEVAVQVEFGSLAAALALAEIYQQQGRSEEAIGLLQQLVSVNDHPGLTLSLVELLAEAKEYDDVVDLTVGVRNEDDLTLQLCLYQAQAMEARGREDSAIEVYREALRARKRDPELLKAARYGRGRLYLLGTRKAQGKKDLARVYADDPDYRDVAQLLDEHA